MGYFSKEARSARAAEATAKREATSGIKRMIEEAVTPKAKGDLVEINGRMYSAFRDMDWVNYIGTFGIGGETGKLLVNRARAYWRGETETYYYELLGRLPDDVIRDLEKKEAEDGNVDRVAALMNFFSSREDPFLGSINGAYRRTSGEILARAYQVAATNNSEMEQVYTQKARELQGYVTALTPPQKSARR